MRQNEEKGRFFAVNEAVSLLNWSSISEYSVSHGKRRFARSRQRNYNKRRLSLPCTYSYLLSLSLSPSSSVYAFSKDFLLSELTCVLTL